VLNLAYVKLLCVMISIRALSVYFGIECALFQFILRFFFEEFYHFLDILMFMIKLICWQVNLLFLIMILLIFYSLCLFVLRLIFLKKFANNDWLCAWLNFCFVHWENVFRWCLMRRIFLRCNLFDVSCLLVLVLLFWNRSVDIFARVLDFWQTRWPYDRRRDREFGAILLKLIGLQLYIFSLRTFQCVLNDAIYLDVCGLEAEIHFDFKLFNSNLDWA